MAFAPVFQRPFSATFDRRAAAAAAGNGLLNALIAYWPGNEVSGNALDLHTSALHLTETGGVTSNPGVVYATARQYTPSGGSDYDIRPGDDVPLRSGDLDFTIATWCYFDSFSATRNVVSKSGFAGNRGYYLRSTTTPTIDFGVSPDGTALVVQSAGFTPGTATWYFVIAWHDSVADTINVQVNAGSVASTSHSSGVFASTVPFQISAIAGGTDAMAGRIGPTAFWKSAGGGGGVLTAAQRTALYNSGAGLAYANFTT